MPPQNRIRVASVPAGHVYIHHLGPVEGNLPGLPEVLRLPDPDPDSPDNPATGKWWPPVMLNAGWIDANAGSFDVFHIHFGFDAQDPAALQEAVTALRRHGKPLIYTVHDLRNPHHQSPAAHDAHLDVLIPAADALITLTKGAAAEIERRWDRRAEVIPHPHVVELDTMADYASRPRTAGAPFRAGVHVKSLRASMDPLPVIQTLLEVAREDGGMVVQVNGHCDVLEPGGARYDAALAAFLEKESAGGGLDVRIHDFLPDDQLWEYLASLDLSVLPYRFGTHSGWLEACRDLGTAVAAPDCGFYADQGPVFGYTHNETGLEGGVHVSRRAHHFGADASAHPPGFAVLRHHRAAEHRGENCRVRSGQTEEGVSTAPAARTVQAGGGPSLHPPSPTARPESQYPPRSGSEPAASTQRAR